MARTVYVDTVNGSASPSDPTNPADAYSSLAIAEAGEQADLTGIGVRTIICTGSTADAPASIDFDGWTTTAADYILVQSATNDRAIKTGWDVTRYRIELTNSVGLIFREDFVRFDGLQVKIIQTGADTAYGFRVIGVTGASPDTRIGNCRIKGECSGTGTGLGISIGDADSELLIYNTIIEDIASGTDIHFKGINTSAATAVKIFNCIVYGCYFGIYGGAETTVKNSAVFGNYSSASDFDGSIGTIAYCASNEGSGTSPIAPYGGNWLNEFVDPANGDFTIVDSGNCVTGGVANPGSGLYSTDIEGNTRGGSTKWCIGVDETDTLLRYVDPDATGTGSGKTLTDAYVSLTAWEAGQQLDLTTIGKISKVLCRSSAGSADTSHIEISGWTTAAANYIQIEAISGHEAQKTGINTSRYRISTTDNHCFELYETDIRLVNLYMQTVYSAAASANCIVTSTIPNGGSIYVTGCYLKGGSYPSGNNGFINSITDVSLFFWNTIVTGCRDRGIITYGTDIFMGNCIVCNNGLQGIYMRGTSNWIIKNCANFKNGGIDFEDTTTGTITVSNCASDDGFAGETNPITETGGGAGWTGDFVDAVNGNFTLLTGSGLKGTGVDDPGAGLYSTDMDGGSYTIGTWDVGVDAFFAAAGISLAAMIAAATQTSTPALAITRALTAAISAATTTSSASLPVTRSLSASIITQTTSSAVVTSLINLTAALAGSTTTSSIALPVIRPLGASIGAATQTPAINLLLDGIIGLAAQINAQTTSSTAALQMTRALAAQIAAQTITPEIVLAVTRSLIGQVTGSISTADVNLTTAMVFIAQINAATQTSVDTALTIMRDLTAQISAGSTTGDAVLAVTRDLSATIDLQTLTSAINLILGGLGVINNPLTISVTPEKNTVSFTTVRTTASA